MSDDKDKNQLLVIEQTRSESRLSAGKEENDVVAIDQTVRSLVVSVDHPSRESEARREIRTADWERLKRRCNRINSPPEWLTILYGGLFGISGSAAVSIVPIAYAQGLPSWAVPVYLAGTISTALIGGVLVAVDRWLRKKRNENRNELLEEMTIIESSFLPK